MGRAEASLRAELIEAKQVAPPGQGRWEEQPVEVLLSVLVLPWPVPP